MPEQLDAGLVVFVQIRLNHTSQENFEEFRRSVMEPAKCPELLSGIRQL